MRMPAYQDLSKEQDKICNMPLDESCVVTGPPGTGKTVLALYRANMLSSQGRRFRVITHSYLLCSYVSNAITELELDGNGISTYHSWFADYIRTNYECYVPQITPYNYDWNKILPLVGNKLPARQRIDLLIDEGQDLPNGFYLVLPYIGRTYTIFADENQAITEQQSTIRQITRRTGIPNERVYLLKRNYRNSRQIAMLSGAMYTGLATGIPELPTRQGPRPVLKRTRNFDGLLDFMVRYYELHDDLEIGVFTQTLALQDRIVAGLRRRTKKPIDAYRSSDRTHMPRFGQPGIKLVTFQSAKGLEFDTVFIPELQEVRLNADRPETRTLFFVLFSRARNELFITYSGVDEPIIAKLLPHDLLDCQL